MRAVSIQEAKKHLSRLIEKAASGESFIIAKAGEPLVRVVPLNAPLQQKVRRIGFMAGQFSVPDDFGRMGETKINTMFGDVLPDQNQPE